MDFLRQAIDIIWNKVPIETYIHGYRSCVCPENELLNGRFSEMLTDYYRELTLEEATGIECQLRENWIHDDNKSHNNISFFYLLIHFTNQVLHADGNNPICEYHHLLRWWETSQLVGPDLLTTAFLAYYDLHQNINRCAFVWPTVLNHNNAMVNVMMQKGLSELHAHLNGSSFNFDLQWLSLMNDPTNRASACNKLEWKNSIMDLKRSSGIYTIHDYLVLAAELRRWLFVTHVLHRGDNMLIKIGNDIPIEKISAIRDAISRERALHGRRYAKKSDKKGKVVDYAINIALPQYVTETPQFVNSLLQGERRILYASLRYIYNAEQTPLHIQTQQALMLYSRIKCMLRQQLIQINARKGFDNFRQYQDDKEIFIKKGTIYEELIKDVALKNMYCNAPVQYIEYRIAPKDTPKAMVSSMAQICKFDNDSYVLNNQILSLSDKCQKYTIVHFIKHAEVAKPYLKERNHLLRKELCQKGKALKVAYSKSRVIRGQLCAIDAANAERVARPEVFAHVFRYLMSELNANQSSGYADQKKCAIRLTYHVGEDFWDVIDGLRAIDEAVLFLNMKDGHRIGHGLALGVNAEEYYRKRHYNAILPQQVLLDNMVWIYNKSQQLNITLPSKTSSYILQLIDDFSYRIYGECFSAQELCLAWQLRGDDIYSLDDINSKKGGIGWHKYDISEHTRRRYEEKKLSERIKEIALLYHYRRAEGDRIVTQTIEKTLIPVITSIQKEIIHELASKHIAVETNPTSNVRIGEFSRYDQHPIFQLKECISVSINTDDLGVFDTSLPNEYSLLACAMEKQRKMNDTPLYTNPQVIYQWLEDVRISSESQRFVKQTNIL